MDNREEHLADVDRVLSEINEMLGMDQEPVMLDELRTLELLLKITKELHNINNVRDLITRVLDSAMVFANADRAFIMLMDDNQQPRFKMGRDRRGTYLDREDFSPSLTIVNRVLDERKTLIIADALSDEELQKRQSIQQMSLRSILCAPLMIKKDLIGLLYADSSISPLASYARSYVKVFASLADQSAVAIRNAQKFETHPG